jgi:HEAT repeat protein
MSHPCEKKDVAREVRLYVPTLMLALTNEDGTVRGAAAESLGDLGADARTAIGALRQARQDREENVRNQADLALEKIRLEVRRAILRAA